MDQSDQEVQSLTRTEVAITSRPKKVIMAEVNRRKATKAGKVYKPTKRESAPNVYINWKSPDLWPLIDRAARLQVGVPNNSELVEKLQGQDDRFRLLSHRRIGEWRDPSVKERIVWSKKTLDEVKKGFLPGGIQTHFNVFVSAFLQLKTSY